MDSVNYMYIYIIVYLIIVDTYTYSISHIPFLLFILLKNQFWEE